MANMLGNIPFISMAKEKGTTKYRELCKPKLEKYIAKDFHRLIETEGVDSAVPMN
jgi:hypothetical protein